MSGKHITVTITYNETVTGLTELLIFKVLFIGCETSWETVTFTQASGFFISDLAICEGDSGTITHTVSPPCSSFVTLTPEPAIKILTDRCFYAANDTYIGEAADSIEMTTMIYDLVAGPDWVYFDKPQLSSSSYVSENSFHCSIEYIDPVKGIINT